jgi:hypothetical protein
MPDVSPFIPAADNLVNGSAIENLGVIRCCGAAQCAIAAVRKSSPKSAAVSEIFPVYSVGHPTGLYRYREHPLPPPCHERSLLHHESWKPKSSTRKKNWVPRPDFLERDGACPGME